MKTTTNTAPATKTFNCRTQIKLADKPVWNLGSFKVATVSITSPKTGRVLTAHAAKLSPAFLAEVREWILGQAERVLDDDAAGIFDSEDGDGQERSDAYAGICDFKMALSAAALRAFAAVGS